ncbi:hypothetical protein D3C86_2101430 [compost metagenome]
MAGSPAWAASVKPAKPLAPRKAARVEAWAAVRSAGASAGLTPGFSAGEAVATTAAEVTSSPSLRDRA